MRLLPVLKPADWNGPALGARARPWPDPAVPGGPLAWVAYAWTSAEGLVYATGPGTAADGGERGGGVDDEVAAKAEANLDRLEPTLETVEADGARLVVVGGTDHAAEVVLSARHLAAVHRALGATEMIVSLARRGVLVAAPAEVPPRARVTLTALHREAWSMAGEARITDALLRITEGEAGAVVDGADGGPVPARA